ncbi:type II toxin-antitoxin system HipA family toxin [Paludibacterium sp. THUN1379]|uniref:type II toxin-antitoxin system HipA family toxin n=1 Tax=Paludibacterium sp. THUN1379 TaxID=3112107 RepID=UPI003086AD79|nr:type II toxin-antitoxin system HipA family toxin [Paludibacterium sp. THUN1379]
MAQHALAVWMNGLLVGHWRWGRQGADHVFEYTPEWLAEPACRPLSLSLPITAERVVRGERVLNYFDNLLPDSQRIRERIRKRFRLTTTSTAALLTEIGRDCVGAVQLLPTGMSPPAVHAIQARPLTELQIESLLGSVTSDAVLGQDGEARDEFRISIAGAQEKSALLCMDGQWYEPTGSTPTTHILKLPLGLVGNRQADLSTSVENEWLCARLMKAWGFPVAETGMATFGAKKVLVVERFDRRWSEDRRWIMRLPQEDFCQAAGLASHEKYESDGGPGMRACLSVLSGSEHAMQDQIRFLCVQFAFWLLAATDGHAKNYSIFHLPGGRYRMTPLYDILSAWPIIGAAANQVPWQKARLAMAIRGANTHYLLREMIPRRWQALADSCHLPQAYLAMQDMVASAEAVLATVEAELPADFPLSVWLPVRDGVRAQCQRFLR